jgi:hypothetical protein
VKTKWNLTKSEQRADSANAERLKFAGLKIGVEHAASSEAPLLRIEQSEYSFICAGTSAGMALVICVRLTVLKSRIIICDYEITIPGCSAQIFLVEPKEGSLKALWLPDFEGDVVLNHRILNGRALPLDKTLDGFLIAQSFEPLPSQFQSGVPISAEIRFTDQWGNVFTSEVRLGVERYKQSLGRPEARPGRTSYPHSLSAQDQELRSRAKRPQV